MNLEVVWSERSLEDIEEIYDYVARDKPDGNYLLIYRVRRSVEIITVRHGARRRRDR